MKHGVERKIAVIVFVGLIISTGFAQAQKTDEPDKPEPKTERVKSHPRSKPGKCR